MFVILLLLCLLVVVLTTHVIVNSYLMEKYSNQALAHQIAHFGGTPNSSQIWPNMVKYPKKYV